MASFELESEAATREMGAGWPTGVHLYASLINHACLSASTVILPL